MDKIQIPRYLQIGDSVGIVAPARKVSPEEMEVTFLYAFTLRWPFSWFGRCMKGYLTSNVQERLQDLKKAMENQR